MFGVCIGEKRMLHTKTNTMTYNLIKRIAGFLVFLISFIVYSVTVEPTASFWDCSEILAAAYRLQIVHPPGAPLYLLLARIFSLFSFGNPEYAALAINMLSVVMSALTAMLLFLTIAYFAEKLLQNTKNKTEIKRIQHWQIVSVIAGLTGAFVFAFSDSFWFSAVEAEVYSTSSFFLALIVWLATYWCSIEKQAYSNRILLLISFLCGLSLGVHMLALLAIPAVVFLVYFRKYTPSKRGVFLASCIAILILGLSVYSLPFWVSVAEWFELLFVNSFHLPFHSGSIFFLVLLVVSLGFAIYYSRKKQKPVLHLIISSYTLMLLGYASFFMIVIRSSANVPLDSNNPEDVFKLNLYLQRDQYPSTPLLSGCYYNAPIEATTTGKPYYTKQNGRYEVADYKTKYIYDERFTTFFPRMYSTRDNHVQAYEQWISIKGKRIQTMNRMGEYETIKKPTFFDNIRFFLRYQVGYMYLRYFLWNFAGRQNDNQGFGNLLHGNWVSGIAPIDRLRLGNQNKLPEHLKNNKANNRYFLIPLIIGIIGMIHQFKQKRKDAWSVLILFLFTGLAVVVYVNEPPVEPRERDYSYTGSFYAFSVWIGLGAVAVYQWLREYTNHQLFSLLTPLVLLLIPVLMLVENFDDHNRSERYVVRDFASNYLNSCEKDAILFTNADNDTYPLWYAQSVESIRTDVRVVCLPYLSAEWYIQQMQRRDFDSKPLPINLKPNQYNRGKRDVIYITDDARIKGYIDISKVMRFAASDSPKTKLGKAKDIDYIPTRKLRIPVDKKKIIALGIVSPENADSIVDNIDIELKGNYLLKNDWIILQTIASNNWERPIYFTTLEQNHVLQELNQYLRLDGFAYRLVPVKTENQSETGYVNSTILYNNLMNRFRWGNMNDSSVYVDDQIIKTTKITRVRHRFARLASQLYYENKRDSAIAVLNKCDSILPHSSVPYDITNVEHIRLYEALGANQKAANIKKILQKRYRNELQYYALLNENQVKALAYHIQKAEYALHLLSEAEMDLKQ